LPILVFLKTSLDLDGVEVIHALFLPLSEVCGLLVCPLIAKEGRHVALGHLTVAVKLCPSVIAHCFVHSGLQTFATLQDFRELSLSVDGVIVLVNIYHLSVSFTELSCLAAAKSSMLFAHWFVLKLLRETGIVQAGEHR
jgi:hypothetical protein